MVRLHGGDIFGTQSLRDTVTHVARTGRRDLEQPGLSSGDCNLDTDADFTVGVSRYSQ
jgi:hypothetical protein